MQPDSFKPDIDQCRIAILYVLDAKGITQTDLASLTQISSSKISKFLTYGIGLKENEILQIANALDAANFSELCQLGEKAAQENSYDRRRFGEAVRNIMHEKNIGQDALAIRADVNRGNLWSHINKVDGPFLSSANAHKVSKALGAKSLRELYKMGGVPPAGPDNGINNILGSILNLPIRNLGTVTLDNSVNRDLI